MRILAWKNGVVDRFQNMTTGRGDAFDQLPDVSSIMHKVSQEGDAALVELTEKYDGVSVQTLRVSSDEMDQAASQMPDKLGQFLLKAAENVRRFSEKQLMDCAPFRFEIQKGVTAGQEVVPIERIGIYVPGGRYPLASSLIMAAIPAQVAGVEQIAVCTPPAKEGCVSPLILGTASMLGINEIYRVGGAHAVAAMASGTESIPKVDKIVGPGNSYVNAAKKWVYGMVGIDFIAGPSEVLIIADEGADAACVASDLIAQAEHDPQAVAILLTNSLTLAHRVQEEIRLQLEELKTSATAGRALADNGAILIIDNWEEAIECANQRAPEHLILNVQDPEPLLLNLKHYGSLFIGALATVVLGDYSAGINHILPTQGAARYTGGLSVRDFLKFQTSLQVDPCGFAAVSASARVLAEAEGLAGHVQACCKRDFPR